MDELGPDHENEAPKHYHVAGINSIRFELDRLRHNLSTMLTYIIYTVVTYLRILYLCITMYSFSIVFQRIVKKSSCALNIRRFDYDDRTRRTLARFLPFLPFLQWNRFPPFPQEIVKALHSSSGFFFSISSALEADAFSSVATVWMLLPRRASLFLSSFLPFPLSLCSSLFEARQLCNAFYLFTKANTHLPWRHG